MHLGPRIDFKALQRTLRNVSVPILLGGSTLAMHEAQLRNLEHPDLWFFDTPQAALGLLQRNERPPAALDASCN